MITNGGSEALSFTFSCLCDHNDEVLVFEPYYTNYNTIARVVGVNLRPIVTKPEDNFRLPSQETMSAQVTERTRAILVTNPNNPTGVVCTRKEIEDIIKTAIDHDLFIIADEVYREFIYDDDVSFISFTDILKFWIVWSSSTAFPNVSVHAVSASDALRQKTKILSHRG